MDLGRKDELEQAVTAKWKIGQDHVVHRKMCTDSEVPTTPYICAPTTDAEMVAHLARLDFKDNHHAAGIATACPGCIEGAE